MKEGYIRKKVIDELQTEGYVCWFPQVPRNVYAPQKDIFGIYDVVSPRKNGDSSAKAVRWTQALARSDPPVLSRSDPPNQQLRIKADLLSRSDPPNQQLRIKADL